ncbi:MAG: RHS repeat-associated core domain-containing protein [Chlamydia sp.]
MFRLIFLLLYSFSLFASDAPVEDLEFLFPPGKEAGAFVVKGAVPEEPEAVSPSLIDYIDGPAPKLHGSISIVSGAWIESTMHLSDTGSTDPYSVGYTYSSNAGNNGSIACGWDILHPKEIVLVDVTQVNRFGASKKEHKNDRAIPLTSYESGSAVLRFSARKRGAEFKPCLEKTGFTHFSSIKSPQPCTPYNTKIHWDRKNGKIEMQFADGTRRLYHKKKERKRAHCSDKEKRTKKFRLHCISFPSGIDRFFYYEGNQVSLVETKTHVGTVIGRVSFKKRERTKKQKKKGIHQDILDSTASDGRQLAVEFAYPHGNRKVIWSITPPGRKKISFSYEPFCSDELQRIVEKREAGGKIVRAKFFNPPNQSKPSNIKKFKSHRIESLSATRLPGQNDPELTYRLGHRWLHHNLVEASITDAGNSVTQYQWDRTTQRIHWIHKKDSSGKKLSSERFIWNDKGYLIRRVIFDDARMPILMKEWHYNGEGNVVSEKSHGYFTNGSAFNTPLQLKSDSYEWVAGGEVLEWTADYDQYDRKVAETNPAGFRIEYRYQFQERRPHLESVYCINPQGAIFQRKFYRYGEGELKYSCIEEINDDGSSYDSTSLENVVVRTIVRKGIWTQMPAWGSLSSQEEFIWTPSSGEQLSKRVEYRRDPNTGTVLEEKVFGSDQQEYAKTEFAYDWLHRCTEVTATDGKKTYTSYNHETGEVSSKATVEGTEYYTYDHDSRIISKKMVYTDGSTLSHHTHNDITGRVITETDDRGREKTTVRDVLGRTIEVRDPKILVDGSHQVPVTTYSYNGMIVEKTTPNGAKEKILFSSHGKPLTVISSTGAITTYQYDTLGREIEKRDQSGYTLKKQYDEYGHIIHFTESFDEVVHDRIQQTYSRSRLSSEKMLGTATTFSYDHFGRLAETHNRDLVTDGIMTVQFSYDAQHRLVSTTYPENGTREKCRYDCMDRILEKWNEDLEGKILSRNQSNYDSLGRLIEERVLLSFDTETWASTFYEYGPYNSVIKTTLSDGRSSFREIQHAVQGDDGLAYYVEKNTGPDGLVVETWKNNFDIVVKAIKYDAFYHAIQKKSVSINIMGQISATEEVPINPTTAEPCGNTVRCTFTYDSLGNLVREERGIGSPTPYVLEYVFDSLSRKIEEVKPSGVRLFYSYDTKGRLLSQKSSDGSVHYQFTYNELDLPMKAEDLVHGETIYRSYTGRKALLEEKFSDTVAISYQHDRMGKCHRVSSALFGNIDYSYENGLLKSVSYDKHTAIYGPRSPLGAALSYTLGDLQVTSSYDESLRRKSIRAHICQKEKPLFSEDRLEFSLQGAVMRSQFSLPQESSPRNEAYRYDALGQIQADSHHEYTFDSLNRAIMLRGETRSFNELHQLQSEKRKYDCDGRVVFDKAGVQYTYDALDRLIALKKNETSVEYQYDAFHRRLSRVEKRGESIASSERFIFQEENEIGSYDSQKRLRSFRLLGEGLGAEIGGTLLIIDEFQKAHYALSDIAGHIRALWDPVSHSLSDWMDYSAFKVASRSDSNISPWSFSSKREEPVANLILFGRRFYDPEEASWMTMDPLGLSDGPNFYAYVHNNPYMSFDLYGLRDEGITSTEGSIDRRGGYERQTWMECNAINEFRSADLPTTGDRKEQYGEMIHLSSDTIMPRDSNVSGLYGSLRDSAIRSFNGSNGFYEKFTNSTLEEPIPFFINGMRTTFGNVTDRNYAAFRRKKGTEIILNGYNSTEGGFKDTYEAARQFFGYKVQAEEVIHAEFTRFLEQCHRHKIKFSIEIHAHSQGAFFADYIIENPSEIMKHFDIKVYTYGGACRINGATNFIARKDPIRCVSFFHDILYNEEKANIKILNSKGHSFGKSHGFDNPIYQKAFYSVP